MAFGEQQPAADGECAEQLGGEPDDGCGRKYLGAEHVQGQGDTQHDLGADDRRGGACLEPEKRGEVGAGSVDHSRDRGQQRDQVDPAGQPGPASAPEATRPRVDAAGDGVLRDDLAEDQRDEELAYADDDQPPDHRRAAGNDGETEQRVRRDHGGEVGEAEREVGPHAHLALELRGVAEGLESRCLVVREIRLRHALPLPVVIQAQPSQHIWSGLGVTRARGRGDVRGCVAGFPQLSPRAWWTFARGLAGAGGQGSARDVGALGEPRARPGEDEASSACRTESRGVGGHTSCARSLTLYSNRCTMKSSSR